ncbi:hypothetical protein R1flu_002738 [Riccia fluitans]|uniref:CCHC-type domain-containing protein n=1 Tax=Riccia fluitans TaxID=41844 RepID=A0ABD1Y772_9MARC
MSDLSPETSLDDENTDSEAGVIQGIPNINFESDTTTDEEQQLVMLSKMVETRYKIDKWTDVGDQPMNDKDKAFMLLRSLSNSLEHLVQTLMYGKDQLLFNDVYSTLLSKDSKKMVRKIKAASTALIVERGRTLEKFVNDKAKGGSKGRSKSRGKSQHSKTELECWKCGKTGHMKKDCKDEAKANEASIAQANVAANRTEADLLSDEDKLHAL